MFKTAIISLGALLLLAGCGTPPRRDPSQPTPPNWDGITSPKPPSAPVILPPAVPPPPVVKPAPFVAPAPETTWVSLNRWAAQRGITAPRRLALPQTIHYSLTTSNGIFVAQPGSRTAYWNQLEFRLGFAPQIIGGQIHLHSLDLKKNLEPLARGISTASRTNHVIVIDPGHGGFNYGTQSVADKQWEKNLTLDWARRLAPLLEQKGWRVLLTRTGDVDVSLPDRVLFAELAHADFFLSLHFNSGGGSEASGLETFCLTPVGMASTLTRDFPDDTTQFFPNNAFDEPNLQLAAQLHRAILAASGEADRGVRRARFPAVLRGQRRPAALIEGGFLSNMSEARRIGDPAHRQRMAEAVAAAMDAFVARPAPKLEEKIPVVVAEIRKPEAPAIVPAPVETPTNGAPASVKPVKRRPNISPRDPSR